jgi:predicted RNase H-like HicB family nuclease
MHGCFIATAHLSDGAYVKLAFFDVEAGSPSAYPCAARNRQSLLDGGGSVLFMDKTALRLTLTAVFEAAPEGGFICRFEELPDVFSEGETLSEAKANLLDALKLVLAYHRDESRKQPRRDDTIREELDLATV